jgi:hypothetical protein
MSLASLATSLVKLEKATIRPKEGGLGGFLGFGGSNQLQCRFNPREITIQAQARWESETSGGGDNSGRTQYITSVPRSVTLELFFDDWESIAGDVSKDVELLLSWTQPTKDSLDKGLPNPSVVVFQWGSKSYLEGYVESVNARYTLFRRDGTPVRATVGVTLKEITREVKRTNPTSGGPPGRRSHVIREGDSLQSIAFREYGDPALWRGLADANGIDDPLRVEVGRLILVPQKAQAAALS